jgi:uncharacterized protein (DUF58 family)
VLHPHIDDLLELRHQARTIGIASHHQVNSILCGLYRSVFRGQGMDFEEVREYRYGDEIRNMDWGVTARTGKAHLKVFREERERTVLLCVDVSPAMQFGTRGTFKSIQAARCTALLGWAANANQDRTGALLFGNPKEGVEYFTPSRVRRSLWRVLKALTREPESGHPEGDPLVEALDRANRSAATGALIFVIGDFNREVHPLEEPLGRLRQRHEVVLIPIDDPADRELPAVGRVILSAPDGSRIELDTDNEAGRRRFREIWDKQRQQLTTMVRSLGIDMMPVSTTENVHQALVRGLRLRVRHMVSR